ncbi:transposase [Emticicia sp. BO119]|uniref:transposase n=1 Tax=Emticicia sp. BO119 TaxID=2757768 RepID=UPI0015F1123A|nr:transposase [Emticicia sp. BO119]MBA4852963.1 transposase [Emticicia sp. BO119]
MKATKIFLLLLAATFLLSNCGGKKEEEKKEEPKTGLEALQSVAEEAEKLSKEGPKEVVDAKVLKELLPADADGMPRTEASSEKTGAMGFKVSTANGRYREGDSSIEVSIVDVAGTGAIMGMAAWAMIDVDKENESGYEKTTTYKDHKSFEKYNTKNNDGEVAVLLANRFVVSVKGNNVSMDKIKATLDDIDLNKLADMK